MLYKVKHKLDRRSLLSIYYADTKTFINYGKTTLRSSNGANLKKIKSHLEHVINWGTPVINAMRCRCCRHKTLN